MLPALMIMDAERSSGVSLAIVVTVIFALPAPPLVGEIVHQLSARVLTTLAVHGADDVNVMVLLPPSVVKSDIEESNVIVGCVGVGLGAGVGSSGSSPPFEQAVISAIIVMTNKKNSNFFICLSF